MSSTFRISRLVTYFLLLVVLLVAVGIGLPLLSSRFQVPLDGPRGEIYLSVATPDTIFPEPRVLEVQNASLTREGNSDTSIGILHSFSKDGSFVTFVGTKKSLVLNAEKGVGSLGEAIQIYTAPSPSDAPLPTPDQAKLMSNDDSLGKLTPAISPDGSTVLYVTKRNATSSLDSFVVHVTTSPIATTTTLFVGNMPKWYDNSTFVYVAGDGVRSYDFKNRVSQLLLPIVTAANTKIGLSPDNHWLAISNPDARKVYLYSLSGKLSAVALHFTHEFSMLGFWTVFSPDSQYIAIQSADQVPNGGGMNPRIEFFDTTTFAQARSPIPLSPFLNERLFVTDWQ